MRVTHRCFDVSVSETVLPYFRRHGNLIHDRGISMAKSMKTATTNTEPITETMQLPFSDGVSVPRRIIPGVEYKP
jgi:hypothetical protein